MLTLNVKRGGLHLEFTRHHKMFSKIEHALLDISGIVFVGGEKMKYVIRESNDSHCSLIFRKYLLLHFGWVLISPESLLFSNFTGKFKHNK